MSNFAIQYEREQALTFEQRAHASRKCGDQDLAQLFDRLAIACGRKLSLLGELEAYRAEALRNASPRKVQEPMPRPYLVKKQENGTSGAAGCDAASLLGQRQKNGV